MARRSVARGDEDEFGTNVLKWSGHEKEWDDAELEGYFSVAKDVLEYCRNADVSVRTWGGEFVGLSGWYYRLFTDDKEALKAEIGARIAELVAQKKGKHP